MQQKQQFRLALIAAVLLISSATALASSLGTVTLFSGMQGPEVAVLQQGLQEIGYPVGSVDGIYGARTQGAVAAFQQDTGLSGDGEANAGTLAALERAVAWRRGAWHAVAPAETLDTVAAKYSVAPDRIAWLNRLATESVYPGQELRIPGGVGADRSPARLADISRLVLGYYTGEWGSNRRALAALQGQGSLISALAPFQFRIGPDGALASDGTSQLVGYARDSGRHVWAVVHNFEDGVFVAGTARSILATPAARQRAVERIAATLRDKKFTGVNIDLEAVPPGMRHEYTRFVELLANRLRPEGLIVSLSIPAKVRDNPADGWSGAFDYAALGRAADLVAIMAYDEHSPGYGPGPVASLPWVSRVVSYAATQIPRQKLLLGVATYGYDYLADGSSARGLSSLQAVRLAKTRGASIQWDDRAQAPYFNYRDEKSRERVVHYENADSLDPKLLLADREQLRGIAVWRLGMEEESIWPMIRRRMFAE